MLLARTQIPDTILYEHLAVNSDRLHDDPSYSHIAQRSGELAAGVQRHREREVALVPVAHFIMRTTLDVLADERVDSPSEVAERTTLAAFTSVAIAGIAISRGVFAHYYSVNEHLQPLLSQQDTLRNTIEPVDRRMQMYIASLGKAAFEDVGIVAGGAMKYMQARGEAGVRPSERRGKWPVERIAGSLALQDITRVPNEELNDLRDYMGMPYTWARRFRTSPNGELDYSAAARARIESVYKPRRGCPGAYIGIPDSIHATLLRALWADTVAYLLPEDATLRAGEDITALQDQFKRDRRRGGAARRRGR